MNDESQSYQFVEGFNVASKLGPGADVVSLTAAISACGAAIQWQHAIALLNAGGDMVLDVRCYNSCLAACENASAWMSALASWWHFFEKAFR